MNTLFYLITVSGFALLSSAIPESMLLIVLPIALISVACWLIFLYKAWLGIQDQETAITPLKAVGLLLIPFFNIYWMFRMFAAYPREYDAYCIRNRATREDLSLAAFHAYPLLCVMSLVLDYISPTIDYVAQSLLIIIQTLIVIRTCRAVNVLVDEGKAAIGRRSGVSPERPAGIDRQEATRTE
jgi:hypothetical protein